MEWRCSLTYADERLRCGASFRTSSPLLGCARHGDGSVSVLCAEPVALLSMSGPTAAGQNCRQWCMRSACLVDRALEVPDAGARSLLQNQLVHSAAMVPQRNGPRHSAVCRPHAAVLRSNTRRGYCLRRVVPTALDTHTRCFNLVSSCLCRLGSASSGTTVGCNRLDSGLQQLLVRNGTKIPLECTTCPWISAHALAFQCAPCGHVSTTFA